MSIRYRPRVIYAGVGGRRKDAMTPKETLEEIDRLKSICSAKSSIYALLVVYCLSLLFRHGYACAPNP